jgi:actin-related protein
LQAAFKAKQEAAEEEARKRREEEKAKREAERKAKEEEKTRQVEERRQRIAEQKAIETEKRREREEREKKEKLARQEREAQQRAEKAERERKAREERLAKEAKEKEERDKKEKERKEKERVEREKAEQKKKEEAAAAIAAANAAAAANATRVKAAQQAAQAQVQAQVQSPNQPPLSPRSASFPPGTIGAVQNNKQRTMPPMPNAKMPPIVAGPSIPRPPNMPPNMPPNFARPPPPQTRPMMPPPHPMGGPPPMSIPMPPQIPILPMGFNPHASPITVSPSGRFPPGQPFPPMNPFGHGPLPSQPQQPPMMNGNVRNFAAPGPMDFPPPIPFDQPQQSQQVTPVLGSRASLPGPSASTTPSSTKPPTNGLVPQGLTGAPGPSNAPTTSPSGLQPVHSRRQSASVTPAPYGNIGTIGKPSPSTIAFGPSSVIGDDDRAIQPPSSRMRASMDDQQVLGSSALVDENDEIVDLSEIKRRGGMGGAVGPAAKNIWATNGTGKGGGWPATPISSSLWSAPAFPPAPGAPARPPPSQQQAAPERLRSPFLSS